MQNNQSVTCLRNCFIKFPDYHVDKFIEKGDLKTMFEYVLKNENALDRSLLRQLTERRNRNAE